MDRVSKLKIETIMYSIYNIAHWVPGKEEDVLPPYALEVKAITRMSIPPCVKCLVLQLNRLANLLEENAFHVASSGHKQYPLTLISLRKVLLLLLYLIACTARLNCLYVSTGETLVSSRFPNGGFSSTQ